MERRLFPSKELLWKGVIKFDKLYLSRTFRNTPRFSAGINERQMKSRTFLPDTRFLDSMDL